MDLRYAHVLVMRIQLHDRLFGQFLDFTQVSNKILDEFLFFTVALLSFLLDLYLEVSVEYLYDLFVHQETGMLIAGNVEEYGGFGGV